MCFLMMLSTAKITQCWLHTNENGTLMEQHLQGKTKVLQEKPVPLPLSPPQTYPTWTVLVLTMGLHVEGQVTNSLGLKAVFEW